MRTLENQSNIRYASSRRMALASRRHVMTLAKTQIISTPQSIYSQSFTVDRRDGGFLRLFALLSLWFSLCVLSAIFLLQFVGTAQILLCCYIYCGGILCQVIRSSNRRRIKVVDYTYAVIVSQEIVL